MTTGHWGKLKGWDGRLQGLRATAEGLVLARRTARGTFTSAPFAPGEEFERAVPFWNARTGPGARVVIRARAWRGGRPLADWVKVATWSRETRGPRDAPTGAVTLDQDTLSFDPAADAIELEVTLERDPDGPEPTLASLGVTTFRARPDPPGPLTPGQPTRPLSVRWRSQRVEAPEIAMRVCGPTSLAMAMEYFDVRRTTAEVAAAAFDPGGAIAYGNWAHLAAVAAEHGLEGQVLALRSLDQLRSILGLGSVAILSLSFAEGELPQAPVPSTQGHLVLAHGVDAEGRVLVNDPAGHREADGRVAYDAVPLARAWKRGIAIVIRRP
jgi:hypothetical protein